MTGIPCWIRGRGQYERHVFMKVDPEQTVPTRAKYLGMDLELFSTESVLTDHGVTVLSYMYQPLPRVRS